MIPQFKHNCSKCVLIGLQPGVDFYLCPPPPGALGEGMFTLRTGTPVDMFISSPVSVVKLTAGQSGYNPFKKALELAEQQGWIKTTFTVAVDQTGGLQTLLNELVLPKRSMSLEEKLLLQNFLTKRALREFKGLPLTPLLKTEMSAKLAHWLEEWELVRA